MERMIEALKKIANENPAGFTVHLATLNPVKKGWVVALKETQNSFGDAGLRKVLAVAGKAGIVGGWNENGKLYWDAVQIFSDEETATAAGIANEQIAIYHIETNRVKYL